MKQTLQLRLGQHLTMTPQLQQAIRLLQLSTLDLKQEIQEALESNPLLDTEEEISVQSNAEVQKEKQNDKGEQELNVESSDMPDELPTDSEWTDTYDNYTSSTAAASQHDNQGSDYLATSSSAQTLHAHLDWQMNLTPFTPTDHAIATALIDAVSEDGYLVGSIEEIHAGLAMDEVELDEVEAVLHRIQSFDPPGVAARNPQECLLIQLHQLPKDTQHLQQATQLCDKYFSLLAARDHNQIKRKLKVDDDELSAINRLICSLNPHPGNQIADSEPQYVVPDVFVSRQKGRWHVSLNPEATPKLTVNSGYASLIRRADQSDDNIYLKNHLQEARWFIKSLMSRNDTLLKVATKIVEFQQGYFDYGDEAMKPMVLRDVAEALEMHESTISRVTTQKYMHTPKGTIEFKYFFSSHVSTAAGGECSATAIRALIKKLISAEKPNKPLSDNKIATILSEQGIEVARRTVAKYRESMGLPPSNERKRLM